MGPGPRVHFGNTGPYGIYVPVELNFCMSIVGTQEMAKPILNQECQEGLPYLIPVIPIDTCCN